MISKKLIEAIQETGKPFHKVAWEAGITPNQLYKLTAGVDRPGRDDSRIKALCEYLNFPLENAIEG